MPDLKTSQETTGGALKDADIFRYSEEAAGNFSSKKHTMATAKAYFREGLERVYNEVPTVDVTRLIVTFADPFVPGTEAVFVETTRLTPTVGYTITAADQITLTDALPPGEAILVDYNQA